MGVRNVTKRYKWGRVVKKGRFGCYVIYRRSLNLKSRQKKGFEKNTWFYKRGLKTIERPS